MAKEWIVPDADLGCDGAYFDYQELVRCRECRWGHLCVTGQHLGLDGFCSKGEREVQDG